jgi:uncharacterized membrane protein YciS (DUF1049 family)
MSTIDAVLIVVAAIIALIAGVIYIRRRVLRYVQHHEHPDQARLRLRWAHFWLLLACFVAYSVGEGVTFARGEDKAPGFAVFWVVFFTWMLIDSILKIRRSQKRISSHDA